MMMFNLGCPTSALVRREATHGRWIILAVMLFIMALHLPAVAENHRFTEPTLLQCQDSDFQRVLLPVKEEDSSKLKASAVWLNRQLIQWQGIEDQHGSQQQPAGRTSIYRLLASSHAGLQVRQGMPASGVEWSVPLTMLQVSDPSINSPYSPVFSPALQKKFRYLHAGVVLQAPEMDLDQWQQLLRQQIILVKENTSGEVLAATRLQHAALLDDLFGDAAQSEKLGVQLPAPSVAHGNEESKKKAITEFALWAPTAQHVALCIYPNATGHASAIYSQNSTTTDKANGKSPSNASYDERTGIWHWRLPSDLSGQYYRFLVDVFVPQIGIIRNLVTDPYSVSLSADSVRSYFADLNQTQLQPDGWAQSYGKPVSHQTDLSVYELHVRDFSVNDDSVPSNWRGKYLAFTQTNSFGMRHLKALAQAGLTDIHLLPVFDFASVPEQHCINPPLKKLRSAAADSLYQQQQTRRYAQRDCFNWGYDPYHFNAPEGSYATDAQDGAKRIIEFRRMVMALHEAGLRVGMDVVFNHTAAAGQKRWSVLDRLVPGYYHRLNAEGEIEQSTCCDNTATEHTMMGKLLLDSVLLWAKDYHIDSFRFDLMAHQPRALMERLQSRLMTETGRFIPLLGEGWNFGEVANDVQFVQASQLSLNGSGIATFNDRARDALRGGGPADSGQQLVQNKGYLNGLSPTSSNADQLTDWVKAGLAGSLRDYVLHGADGCEHRLEQIDYHGQPVGYVSQPSEVVNYVENHDNQTLFDNNVYKLPTNISRRERARVQAMASAIVALSQGIAYFHAGQDLLRSKSLDRNSFDSGDWFNRLDWRYRDHYFGSGLPPAPDNAKQYPFMRPLLRQARIKPDAATIRWTADVFQDFLKIRTSSSLFRLPSASAIQQRLRFETVIFDGRQNPQELLPIAMHLDGQGEAGAQFKDIMVIINAARHAKTIRIESAQGKSYRLHPVQAADRAADLLVKTQARFNTEHGRFTVPAQSVVVFVQ